MTADDGNATPTSNRQPEADAAVLHLRELRVVHPDGTVALDGVTLDVAPGEVVAVVGPSGSGKTTLLRAVAGLAQARGTVEIGGRDVSRLNADQRNLAMVFETGALISFLNIEDNIGFGLRIHKVPKDERQDRVASEAGRLRLGRLLNRKPANLSAGERNRAHIGRALVRRPSAWLLDEPLAHLDPAERFELRHRLVLEAKRQAVPTLYVTHDPAEALAVGDRVAVLHGGRLVQVDTPHRLYTRPVNAFVATFVASQPVGLLLARVIRSGGLAGFQVGDRTLPFWSGVPAELTSYVGKAVVLALRPEEVRDAAAVDDPDVARLHGVVVATEFTGPSLLAAVQIEAPAPSCPGIDTSAAPTDRALLVARLPRDHPVQLAADLTLAVNAARAHVFDPSTGEALWHPDDLVGAASPT